MESTLYLKQLPLGPMENFVYLVGAKDAREVLVVDAAWDVSAIEAAAEADGKVIAGAFASHCHGDHINGLPELLSRHDIPVFANAEEVAFSEELRKLGDAVRPVKGGDALPLAPGLTAIHTPGHTPGSQCLLARGALVSGDTVFINGCGRCDMRGGDPEAMYDSLTRVLAPLSPETRLYPGHDYADHPSSTLAEERAHNPYFRFGDLQAFVAYRMRPRK
jgi:glyoxylase-like metal-dependent hydrolase (beta-lactamase superfamily II)